MWLSRLDLLAFGKFTEVRLDLGPGLHLVYGPNEAGKSTTLRAIRQLFFGFDERTSDNFLHANPNLRIGATICSEPDLELKVIRRKTRKDSLRVEDDDTVIEADRWNQWLSGVDELTFSQRYGIDYEQLVEGGRQIATGSGDLGEILFATGSGVTDLNAIKKRLTEEAEEIFKPQGKRQRLNQSILKWQELKDQVREKLLSVSVWEEADRSRQEALARLNEVSNQLTRHAEECDRYRRWQQAWPLVREIDTSEYELLKSAMAPRLAQDFGTKRQEAMLLLQQARTLESAAAATIQQAQRELDKLAEPNGLIGRVDEISKIITEWGSCQKGIRDRRNLIEQRDCHIRSIGELQQSLNRSPDELPDPIAVLDRSFRTRLGLLGRQRAGLVQSLENAEFHTVRVKRQAEEAQSVLIKIPLETPLAEFQDLLRRVQSDGDLELRLTEVREELSAIRADAQQQIAQLGIGSRSIDDVIRMKIPDSKILLQLEADFQSNQAERSLLGSRLEEMEKEHSHLEQKIETLRREFQVPTESDLEVARSRRMELWSQIRNLWSSSRLPSDELIGAFESSIHESDRISDRLRKEADRVAQLAEELADIETNEARQHEASIRLAELDAHRIALENRWKSEWPDLKENAPPHREIQTWLTRRESLLRNEELARKREHEAGSLAIRIQQNIAALARFMSDAIPNSASPVTERSARTETQQLSFGWEPEPQHTNGLEGIIPAEFSTRDANRSLKEYLRQAEERLKQDDAAQQSRRETIETIARLNRESSDLANRTVLARCELDQWKSHWNTAMETLRLPFDTTPDAADNFLVTFNELADHRRQAEQLQERISGIDTDVQKFEVSVLSICEDVATDLKNADVADAVTALRDRLMASQREEAIRAEHIMKKSHADEQLVRASETKEQGERLLAELCTAASVSRQDTETEIVDSAMSVDATFKKLETAENQSRNRDRLEEQLARTRTRLTELSGDEPVAQFTEHLRQQSFETLTSKLQDGDIETSRLEAGRDLLNRQLGGFDTRLSQMDGGAEAAEAEETRQQCLAQIRSEAEEYVRLKLASSILHASIERYREKTRGPVLAIASELFRELTLESFSGLRVDEDDNHKPILVGVRSNGRDAVGVGGMSEGTCDQLYLALRLASLQSETAPRRGVPLIIDDILIQFDDARAIAALRIMSRFAQERQVIFFTHHEHLLDLAGKHLQGGYSAHRLQV